LIPKQGERSAGRTAAATSKSNVTKDGQVQDRETTFAQQSTIMNDEAPTKLREMKKLDSEWNRQSGKVAIIEL
jgi:hypothetical protein